MTKTYHKSGLRETIRFYLVDCRTRTGKIIDVSIILFNLLVCLMYIIESYPLSQTMEALLWKMEIIAVSFFIVEYLARLYASRNRWRYLTGIYSIIDLVAILPVLLMAMLAWFGFTLDVTFVNIIRVFKVFRIFRFIRFLSDTDFFFGRITFGYLKLLRLLMTILIIFFVSSGLFYQVENQHNPEVRHFGDAFYYTVVTLTTVGFGDITPISSGGRWVTVVMILSGIILIPWQASQVMKEWFRLSSKREVTCPNCGLMRHDEDASHCKACGHVIYQEYDGG